MMTMMSDMPVLAVAPLVALFWLVVKTFIFMAIASALAPKPKGAKPATASEFTVSTASEGRMITVLWGRKRIRGPNCVWYGNIRPKKKQEWTDKMFGKKVTVGYRYSMGMHLILSHCIEKISQFWVGEKVAWPVVNDPTQYNLTGTTTIQVSALNILGGKKREGGVSGKISVQFGHPDQTANPYLVQHLGPLVPAYLYQTGVIFEDFYFGDSPYLREFSFMGHRTGILANGSPQWYPAKADINGDCNPAHIIRECLTDPDWSIGESVSNIDDDSFVYAADILYNEGFGLGFLWDASCTLQEFINEVLAHIDGVLFIHPATDKWTLRLLREDYEASTLEVFDEDEIEEIEHDTSTISEVVNKIVVEYHNLVNPSEPKTATAVDNSLVERQGGAEIEKVIQFPGINDDTLANVVAHRELRRVTSILPQFNLKANRKMAHLLPGDLFKLSWSARNITELVVRVVKVNLGSPNNNVVTIGVVRDVFEAGVPVISNNIPTEWVNPHSYPIDTVLRGCIESPYWFLAKYLYEPDDMVYWPNEWSKLMVYAARPVSSAFGYELWVRDSASLPFYYDGDGAWAPTALVAVDVPAAGAETTIYLDNCIDLDTVEVGMLAKIDDEFMYVTSVDSVNNVITAERGSLDTIPAPHGHGTSRAWFIDLHNIVSASYAALDTPAVKFLTETGEGILEIDDATELVSSALAGRYKMPYPPGNFKINAVSFPATFSGQPTLSWAHRTRLKIDAIVAHDDATSYGPEQDQTYTLEIYSELNVLVRTVTGLTGTSYTYTEGNERADCGLGGSDPLNATLRFRLWSVSELGVASLQAYDIVVART